LETNGNGYSHGRAPDYGDRRLMLTNPDHLPPHNIECEQAVLGSILYDNEVLPVIMEHLQAEDFYRDAHQVIYRAILDIYERGDPELIDVVALHAELERMGQWEQVGATEYMRDIVESVPHAANGPYYAGVVKEKATNRQLIEMATQAIRDGYSNQLTAGQLWDQLDAKLSRIKHSGSVDPTEDELSVYPLPAPMEPAAFHGVAGEIVRIIAPETEACPESILVQLVAMMGCAFGPRPHFRIFGTVHRCNLDVCLVSETGQGRKGTAFDAVNWLLKQAYPGWDRPRRGLVSGEGLIEKADKQRGPLLVLETEFGGTLGIMGRQGNSLCAVFKQAWDGPYLDVTTKNHSISCDNAYVTLVAHMTYNDVATKLSSDDIQSGLINRMLISHSYSSRKLPRGGSEKAARQALDPLVKPIIDAIDFAQKWDDSVPYFRDPEAEAMWEPLYTGPLTSVRAGLYGAATVRRPVLIMRMAMIYAILDQEKYIGPAHLKAALAIWEYCDRTAAHIWGKPQTEGNLGKLLAFMETANVGLTRKEINRRAFGSHLPTPELERLLNQAQASGQLVYRLMKTKGRDRHEWVHRAKS